MIRNPITVQGQLSVRNVHDNIDLLICRNLVNFLTTCGMIVLRSDFDVRTLPSEYKIVLVPIANKKTSLPAAHDLATLPEGGVISIANSIKIALSTNGVTNLLSLEVLFGQSKDPTNIDRANYQRNCLPFKVKSTSSIAPGNSGSFGLRNSHTMFTSSSARS